MNVQKIAVHKRNEQLYQELNEAASCNMIVFFGKCLKRKKRKTKEMTDKTS